MKHWDGQDRDQSVSLHLSRRDRRRFAQFLEAPAPARAHQRRESPHIGSVIGLVLAVGLLAGLAWVLAPTDAVSSRILN